MKGCVRRRLDLEGLVWNVPKHKQVWCVMLRPDTPKVTDAEGNVVQLPLSLSSCQSLVSATLVGKEIGY